LHNECERLLKRILWSTILRREVGEEEGLVTPDYQRRYGPDVQLKAAEAATKIQAELEGNEFTTSVLLPPRGAIQAGHLGDMFDRFFAGKQFVGPVPDRDGRLQFKVTLETGQSHGIDDLSSGEKELIYGYLRVRSRAPRNSVLLLDEPELHLNPRLMRGLAHFLQEHLGSQSNNQLWIATHSDALLREVWGSADCSSFHIRLPDAEPISGPQGVPIAAESDLDRAILDLAGPATFDLSPGISSRRE
jgi:AAA domain, putative AbiEii toxin, Type IV TA system